VAGQGFVFGKGPVAIATAAGVAFGILSLFYGEKDIVTIVNEVP
jgi:hypothetical protein